MKNFFGGYFEGSGGGWDGKPKAFLKWTWGRISETQSPKQDSSSICRRSASVQKVHIMDEIFFFLLQEIHLKTIMLCWKPCLHQTVIITIKYCIQCVHVFDRLRITAFKICRKRQCTCFLKCRIWLSISSSSHFVY